MKNQLKPNTYTICETTEQCKELFEWAKANGLTNCDFENGSVILHYSDGRKIYDDRMRYIHAYKEKNIPLIPLPEFIARLKGEWVEGKTVTLNDGTWSMLLSALDANEVNDYSDVINEIKEQLNKQ